MPVATGGCSRALIGRREYRLCAENMTFAGLALDNALAKEGVEARCGLMAIDLRSGDIVHWLRIQGIVNELYDVAALPGVVRPIAFGFKSDEIARVITLGEERQAS